MAHKNTNQPIPDELRSDHLFLLVGKNPLPNLVAASLLAKPDATIWLLHSDDPEQGRKGTKRAAEALEIALLKRDPDLTIRLEPVSSSNNLRIQTRIKDLLRQNHLKGTVGLNYTGGTKVMAVHVYRVLEQESAKTQPRPIFSYLDPRKLALRVDGYGTTSPQIFYILKDPALREMVEISLDELAELHGYVRGPERPTGWADPYDTPGLLDLCAAIAQVHASSAGFEQWRRWIHNEKFQGLPDPMQYSRLKPVRDALDQLCGGPGQATPIAVAEVLRPDDRNPKLISCSKWFIGMWLEEHSAACLLAIASELEIKFSDKNLEYIDRREGFDIFELDAAAMFGYQIYSISCIATERKPKAKEHFLEVYVRTRQLGGDEARAGVVCLVEDPKLVEKEVAREWDTEGQLKVFGRNDLKDLTAEFRRWFETAN